MKKLFKCLLILTILGLAWGNLATDAEKNELTQSIQEQIEMAEALAGVVVKPYKRFVSNVVGVYLPAVFHGLVVSQTPQQVKNIQARIIAHATALGVDPRLALAVAKVESNFNPYAVSRVGAIGVMQVMPATARHFGVTRSQLFDADTNIRTGILYLKKMLNTFRKKELAIGAYNCGPQNIIKAGYRIPDFPETVEYVKKVNRAIDCFRMLAVTSDRNI